MVEEAAAARTLGAQRPEVELRPVDGRLELGCPVEGAVQPLAVRRLEADFHGDVPEVLRYPADDLIAALWRFRHGRVRLWVAGPLDDVWVLDARCDWADHAPRRRVASRPGAAGSHRVATG